MLANRLTNPDVHSWEEAWSEVNLLRAVIDGATSLIPAQKIRRGGDLIVGWGFCLAETKNLKFEDLGTCGIQSLVDLVFDEICSTHIDLAIKRIHQLWPNAKFTHPKLNKNQLANAPPVTSDQVVVTELTETKTPLLLPERSRHLKHIISDYPILNNKLAKLGDLKEQFFKDFDDLADDQIDLFEQNPNLVDSWKRLFNKGASKVTRKLVAYDINIENVRPGTNGKYAVIGRSMSEVEKVANQLKSLGADVEILDDKWLGGKTYEIDGYSFTNLKGIEVEIDTRRWTIKECIYDMNNSKHYIRTDGWIAEVEIIETPMYKFNQKWIDDIRDNGYEIIDIGNPLNSEKLSPFYEMEKTTLNFK